MLNNKIGIGLCIVAQEIQDGRFYAAERKIEFGHVAHRKPVGQRVTAFGVFVDERPAGVRQAQQLGRLIEGFAHGVVLRLADNDHVERPVHAHNLGMPPTDGQAQKRERRARGFDKMGQYVGLHVVDLNERDVQS